MNKKMSLRLLAGFLAFIMVFFSINDYSVFAANNTEQTIVADDENQDTASVDAEDVEDAACINEVQETVTVSSNDSDVEDQQDADEADESDDVEIEDEEVDPKGIICPVCHTSYSEFVKESRFGCPDCYDVFDLMMGNQIKTIQGSEEHRGKHPVHMRSVFDLTRGEGALKTEEAPVLKEKVSIEEKISVLRLRLKEAIHEEDYESAASLRDEIRALEAGVTDHE